MPLPNPNSGELQQDFMARCYAATAGEYDDPTEQQQACTMAWTTGVGDPAMLGAPSAMDRPDEAAEPMRKARAGGHFRGEVRALEDGDGPLIEGYAAVFNKLSQPLEWGYRERIMPGAFTQTIKNGDVRALFNHDPNHVLGRTTAGTLTLREDSTGLHYTVRPPDEPWVRSLVASIKRGDIDQSSFAFAPVQEDWSKNDKTPVRNIREVRLFDVSPVTFPAYVDTIVQARTQSLWEVLRGLEPATSHSDPAETPQADPATSQSEPEIRELNVMIRRWRLAGLSIHLDGTRSNDTWHAE